MDISQTVIVVIFHSHIEHFVPLLSSHRLKLFKYNGVFGRLTKFIH